MTAEAQQRRREKDHQRYTAHKEERCAKQRAYYATHREQCIASVRNSERKLFIKNYGRKATKVKISTNANDNSTE